MSTKVCSKCSKNKTLNEFYQKKKYRSGEYYDSCIDCMKKRGIIYYHQNHERQLHLANLRKDRYILRSKKFIYDFKKGKTCLDCGKIYKPFVMEFDHREGEFKIESVSNFANHRSSNLEKLKLEIIKCDLVCANCHRIRTYDRMHAAIANEVKAGA